MGGEPPDSLFARARAELDRLFAGAGAPVVERIVHRDGVERLRLEHAGWPRVRVPIEVVFDDRARTILFTTLETHPFRAVATLALTSDGERGSVVRQTNHYERGPAAALAGALLGGHDWFAGFWRRFHAALASTVLLPEASHKRHCVNQRIETQKATA
jgi:hypothetical protein